MPINGAIKLLAVVLESFHRTLVMSADGWVSASSLSWWHGGCYSLPHKITRCFVL